MTTDSASHKGDRSDLYGGLGLALATLAALLVANSALEPEYTAFLHLTGEVRIGSIGLAKSLEHWINDGLIAIFFLLVGLEIKREAREGALASLRQAANPRRRAGGLGPDRGSGGAGAGARGAALSARTPQREPSAIVLRITVTS